MLKNASSASVLLLLAITLLNYPSFAFEDQNSDGMIVRLCPPPGRVTTPHGERCTGYPFKDLMESPDDWTVTRSVIDYFAYPSWILNDNFTNVELASYFAQMNNWNMNFVLGVMAIKDLPYARTGESCYNTESARWNRFDDLGLTISALGIDEPLTAVMGKGFGNGEFPPLTDMEYAVRETADFLELARSDSVIGDIPISLIEAYPRYGQAPPTSKDEIIEFIVCLQEECASRGIEGISDLAIDYNWCGYSSSYFWGELLEIEEFADSIGLPFAMIFWPARSYSPLAPDSAFYVDIMYEGNLYFNTYQGSPDIVDVTAWDYIPRVMVPESFGIPRPPNVYPFTWSFLQFYDTYVNALDSTAITFPLSTNIHGITSIYPNPVGSGSTVTIQFLPPANTANVLFEVFDIAGHKIRSEDINTNSMSGNTYSWNRCTDRGRAVSSGIYFVKLTFDEQLSSVSRLVISNN